MRLLDKKQRLFGIVNPIDALVVVAVVIAVVVVANILFGVNPRSIRVGHGSRKVEIVLRAGAVGAFDPQDLAVGDKVIKVGGSNILGTVAAVKVDKATMEGLDGEGNPRLYQSQVLKDVFITIDGTGDINSDGAFIGDEQVRVNTTLDLAGPRWEADKCRVMSMKVVD